jgi:ankyrin repeat protein
MVECQAWIPLSFCTTANEGADFILDPRNFDAAVLDDQHADLHQLSVHSTLLDLRANNRDSIVSQPPESDHSYYAVNRGSPFYDTHAFDANGATLVHQCFQHKRFDLVKWMVHHFPTFSLEPYRSTYMNNELPCGGQNILHLAVRSKNYCMAKWLLEFYCGQADATMLSRLLMGGARVEMYGHRRDGLTPLQLAAIVKDNEDIKLLIDSYHSPVPLSFRKRQANPAVGHVGNPASAVTRTQTDGNIADVQGLNSRAANEHYCRQSTYYYLHTDNCTSIDRNEYIASSSLDPLCKPHKWDANGATILHQCFQHRKYELVKWIITKFPRFSLEPHLLNKIDATGNCTKLPYGGQNILHMAVLAKNHVMAKWILDFYSRLSDVMLHDLLTARVYTQSGYFDKKGDHYFGETPLHFAVCMDDVEMVNLIMSFTSMLEPVNIKLGKSTRNLLFYPDCNGNNVAHLCAKHSLDKMYEHLKYFAVEMLQQELMIALHSSLLLPMRRDKCEIDYEKFFGDSADFKFRGFVRHVGAILLPKYRVRKDFLLAQIVKHLESLKTTEAMEDFIASLPLGRTDVTPDMSRVAILTSFLRSLRGGVGIKPDEVNAAIDATYDHLKAELKRKLSRWLYGVEIGVKSGEINRMFNLFFIYGLNEDGHSPATLAALKGKSLMLRHFLKENVSQKDRSYEFDLTGIEFKLEGYSSINDANGASRALYTPSLGQMQLHSSISWVCRASDPDVYSMINTIPEITAVVDFKWERVGSVLLSSTYRTECFFMVVLAMLALAIDAYSQCLPRKCTSTGETLTCANWTIKALLFTWILLLLACSWLRL